MPWLSDDWNNTPTPIYCPTPNCGHTSEHPKSLVDGDGYFICPDCGTKAPHAHWRMPIQAKDPNP